MPNVYKRGANGREFRAANRDRTYRQVRVSGKSRCIGSCWKLLEGFREVIKIRSYIFFFMTFSVWGAVPCDLQSKILSFCGTKELLTLRRTSVSAFSAVLDREFRARTPPEVILPEDVRVFVTLLNDATLICKTAGYKLFRLRDVDTEELVPTCVPNHYYANGADVQLFSKVDLFLCAIKRHGSVARLGAYDTAIKRRTLVAQQKKHQRQLFLDRHAAAYKLYLARRLEEEEEEEGGQDTYRAQICEIEREYAARTDRRESERFRQDVLCQTEALASEYKRSQAQETRKRKLMSSFCLTCVQGPAATACSFQQCGNCCGRSADRQDCKRHAARRRQ